MNTNSAFEQAKVHADRNETDESIKHLVDALNEDVGNVDAAMMLGGALIEKGNFGVGAIISRFAVDGYKAKGARAAQAMRNLGSAFKAMHREDEAEIHFKMALLEESDPRQRALINASLGTCFVHRGTPEKAIEYFNEGLKLWPDNEMLRFNRGLALLEIEQWEQGWADLHKGFHTGARRQRHYGDLPIWDGSSGKTVIIWGEQGIGDELLYASCIPDMMKVCKRVIFDCHPRLVNLFARSFPTLDLHGTRKQMNVGLEWIEDANAEAHICVSDLPMFFRNRDEDFPGDPYLKAVPNYPRKDSRFHNSRRRIGISWEGGTQKTRTDLRSIPLALWAPLLRSLDAEIYSLQYTDSAAQQVCEFEEKHNIRVRHLPGMVQPRDYDVTAGFVASMDTIITVTTTICDLAGSLGVPTWCLVPSQPPWRYAGTRDRSIWYNSVNLVRQKPEERWEHVLARVAQMFAQSEKVTA